MGVVSCFVLFERCRCDCGLPVSATMATAAMAAATMAAATVEAAAAARRATAEATADCYVRRATAESANSTASCETRTATGKCATVEAAPETTSAKAAVEPRASTYEDAAREPARTVVTVRRAGVWVVSIVAVGASGGRTDVPWADAYAHYDALALAFGARARALPSTAKTMRYLTRCFIFGPLLSP